MALQCGWCWQRQGSFYGQHSSSASASYRLLCPIQNDCARIGESLDSLATDDAAAAGTRSSQLELVPEECYPESPLIVIKATEVVGHDETKSCASGSWRRDVYAKSRIPECGITDVSGLSCQNSLPDRKMSNCVSYHDSVSLESCCVAKEISLYCSLRFQQTESDNNKLAPFSRKFRKAPRRIQKVKVHSGFRLKALKRQ